MQTPAIARLIGAITVANASVTRIKKRQPVDVRHRLRKVAARMRGRLKEFNA